MSLLEKATIITTPTAQSNGKLHSIKGGTDADFDVVRGSAATRVNAEGLIENINVLSGEILTNGGFDADGNWTKGTGWSISGGVASCDGTQTTVSFLTQNGQTQSGKTYKVTYDIVSFTSGEIIAFIGGSQGQTRTSVGTYTEYLTTSNTNFWLRANSDFVGSIDNISVKEIIDATNIPRIDYTTGEGVILTEPQSTNLITYSEDFSDASWSKVRSSVSSNEIVSPSGNLDAYKFFDSTDNNTHLVFDSQSVNIGSVYSFSFFIKKGTLTKAFLAWNSAINQSVVFDLENGLVDREGVDVDSSNIEDYGNDWFKCSFTHTANMPSILYRVGTYDGNIIYTGTGNDYIYIWGAQLEQQLYSTSYIPTSGAIATRFEDELSGAGSTDLINSEEGVLYADISSLVKINPSGNITLTDGTGGNRIYVYYLIDNSISVIYNINSSGASINNFLLSDITEQTKIAVRWGNGNVSVWINGTSVLSNTASNFLPNILNSLSFAKPAGGGNFYGKTKTVAVFSEALSDEELTCLTTI